MGLSLTEKASRAIIAVSQNLGGRPGRQRPPNMAGIFYPNSWASLANPNPVALIPYPAGTMAVAAAQTVVAGAAAPIAVHVAAMPSVVRQIPTVVRCAGLRQ